MDRLNVPSSVNVNPVGSVTRGACSSGCLKMLRRVILLLDLGMSEDTLWGLSQLSHVIRLQSRILVETWKMQRFSLTLQNPVKHPVPVAWWTEHFNRFAHPTQKPHATMKIPNKTREAPQPSHRKLQKTDILAMDLNISFPSSLQPESLLMTPLWRPLTSQQSKTIQLPHPLAKTRTATSTQQSRNPSTTPTRRTPGLPEKWNYSSSPTRTSQLHTTH